MFMTLVMCIFYLRVWHQNNNFKNMNKYKVLGIVNILIGLFQIFSSWVFSSFVISKINSMYQDFGMQNNSGVLAYVFFTILFVAGVVSILIGLLQLTKPKDKDKDKYFRIGTINAIVAALLLFILTPIGVITIITPIYSMTSQF